MRLDDDLLRAALAPLPRTWEAAPGERHAAVLAALFNRAGSDWLLFTERHADLPSHPGQIAFPGGAREGDEDPVTCALRESHEEVGLPPASVHLLGALATNRTSSSTFRVHTLVGRITGLDGLRPDPREVTSVFAVPFAELADDQRWTDRTYETGGRVHRASPHFVHGDHLIWGLTGRLTRDLVAAARRALLAS